MVKQRRDIRDAALRVTIILCLPIPALFAIGLFASDRIDTMISAMMAQDGEVPLAIHVHQRPLEAANASAPLEVETLPPPTPTRRRTEVPQPEEYDEVLAENSMHIEDLKLKVMHYDAVAWARAGEHDRAITRLDKLWHRTSRPEAARDLVVVQAWDERHAEAAFTFETLLTSDEAPPYVLWNTARSYEALSRPDQALALYGEALRRDPSNTEVRRALVRLLFAHGARYFEPGLARLDPKTHTEAPPAWLWRHTMELAPNRRALALAREGETRAALQLLRTTAEKTTAGDALLRDLTALLFLSSRDEQAFVLLGALGDSVAAAPELYGLASAAKLARGDHDTALSYAERWRRAEPRKRQATSAAVQALLALGETPAARAIIASAPSGAAWRKGLGADLLLFTGDFAGAQELYRAARRAGDDAPENRFGLAIALARRGLEKEAEGPLTAAITHMPAREYRRRHALSVANALALARLLIRNEKDEEAVAMLEELVTAIPAHLEARLMLARLYEKRRDYFAALKQLDYAQRISPMTLEATHRRRHNLLRLTAISLVKDELAQKGEEATPELAAAIAQQEAVQRLSWRNAALATPLFDAFAESASPALARTTAALVALQAAREPALAVAAFEALRREGAVLGEAGLRAAADAYAELGYHEEALTLYRELAAKLAARGDYGYPASYSLRLGEHRSLTRLGRFAEAREVLEALELEVPTFTEYRGAFVPNWHKAELAAERGYWLLMQDRLAEAAAHFEAMTQVAPRYAPAHIGLAHAHELRGLRRLALRDLEIALTHFPNDTGVLASYAALLLDHGEPEEAAKLAARLEAKSPDDPKVRELLHKLELTRMQEFSLYAYASLGSALEHGVGGGLALHTPVHPRADLVIGAEFQRELGADLNTRRERARAGLDATPWAETTVLVLGSVEPSPRRLGLMAEAAWRPSDHLTMSLAGDSDTWELPPKAQSSEITGRDLSLAATYHHSELFEAGITSRLLGLSDGNRVLGGTAWLEPRLFADGRMSLRLRVEAIGHTARDVGRAYYLARQHATLLVTPRLERVWYRGPSYSIHDSLTAGWGIQYERDHPQSPRALVRYEQLYRFGDTVELNWAIGGARQSYGREVDYAGSLTASARVLF